MAVVFEKIGNNNLSVYWDFGDLEICGGVSGDYRYRYTYVLFRNSTTYNTVGPTLEQSYSWFALPEGTYRVEIVTEYEPFGSGTGWVQCDVTYISSNIVITPPPNIPDRVNCIPINESNISFESLSKFFGVNSSNVELSGPNNPSTAGSLFGNSGLPNTGTISKTRPNAVSELRGSCGGKISWEDSLLPNETIIRGNHRISSSLDIGFTANYFKSGLVNTSGSLITNNSCGLTIYREGSFGTIGLSNVQRTMLGETGSSRIIVVPRERVSGTNLTIISADFLARVKLHRVFPSYQLIYDQTLLIPSGTDNRDNVTSGSLGSNEIGFIIDYTNSVNSEILLEVDIVSSSCQ